MYATSKLNAAERSATVFLNSFSVKQLANVSLAMLISLWVNLDPPRPPKGSHSPRNLR